jgi:hypothetical protein
MAPTAANTALPPLILPPWLVEKDRYNIKLPHIDTLVAIADKGRRPHRTSCPIGPAPSGLYKTAQDTIPQDVPKLVIPTTQYVFLLTSPSPPPLLLAFHPVIVSPFAHRWRWPPFFLGFVFRIGG